MRIISLIAVTLFTTLWSVAARSENYSASQILLNLPVCELYVSLAPTCKTFDHIKFRDFRLNMLQDIKSQDLGNDEATIETDDWYFSIDDIEKTSNGFTFYFTDDAKHGTYLTVEKYFVEIEPTKGAMKIIAFEIYYRDGADQDYVGTVTKFGNPIDMRFKN